MTQNFNTTSSERPRNSLLGLFRTSLFTERESLTSVGLAYESKLRRVVERVREAVHVTLGRDDMHAELEELRERLSHAEAAIRQLQRSPELAGHGMGPTRKVGLRRPNVIGIVR